MGTGGGGGVLLRDSQTVLMVKCFLLCKAPRASGWETEGGWGLIYSASLQKQDSVQGLPFHAPLSDFYVEFC